MGSDVSRLVEFAVQSAALAAELQRLGNAEEVILQAGIQFPPKPVLPSTPALLELERGTKEFSAVMLHFTDQWRHPTRVPMVVKIWKIHGSQHLNDRFSNYQRAIASKRNVPRGNTRLLWHGTIRTCRSGDSSGMGNLCNNQDCSICGIIRTSFSIAKVGQHHRFSRFGRGIYTTGTSSKANDYVVERGGSPFKAMLLSEVVAGKEARKTANDLTLSKPPDECDSVLGVPGVQSVLNYDEVVVYRDEAIRPSFLVIYC